MILHRSLIIFAVLSSVSTQSFEFVQISPDQCREAAAGFNQYFDVSVLVCKPCKQSSEFQSTSADGFRCECSPGYKLIQDFGGEIECEKCPNGQVSSAVNKWECVACANDTFQNPGSGECLDCAADEIPLERQLDGTWDNPASPSQTCTACAASTSPDIEGLQCVRCDQVLSMISGQVDCQCPSDQEAGGICFRNTEDIPETDTDMFLVNFDGTSIASAFFYNNLQSAYGLCSTLYNNFTACQLLGNMCVMILYNRDNEGNTDPPYDPCSFYLEYSNERGVPGQRPPGWKNDLPWLYYDSTTTDILLNTELPTEYTFPDSKINIKAAVYSYNGTFLSYQSVEGGLLQLCPATDKILDAAWNFGTSYKQECDVKVKRLFDDMDTLFYDLYLEYTTDGSTYFYPIPVLLLNYEQNGERVNEQGGWKNDLWLDWQLTRRIMLVDNINGRPEGTPENPSQGELEVVRYAQEIKLTVRLQEDQTNGKIYPPYLTIKYASASRSEYLDGTTKAVTFNVEYLMDTSEQESSMSIALGVLAGCIIFLSLLQVWIWSKRAGQIAIDCVTLIKFLLYICGNLGNVFFVVSLGYALFTWIFFKEQSTVRVFLPAGSQEQMVIIFLVCALVFKLIHVFHLLISQISVDIFFVDWERPRAKVGKSAGDDDEIMDGTVSVWRTYFVANEWNEIQTLRKINFHAQLFITVFFLSVIGFENLGTSDPLSDFNPSSSEYHAPPSRVLRYAIGGVTYLIVAVVQWFFITFIYERFFDNPVQDFVDFCSLNNVSVFIMENRRFGYYIHGRSVHGQADVGLQQMFKNMKREEDDMCGKRGLIEDTEQQTFQIAVPRKLRDKYDQVMRPLLTPDQAGGKAPGQTGNRGGDVEQGGNLAHNVSSVIAAYKIINKFFQKFIEHSLKNIDYSVKDKNFFETILNAEFDDTAERGIFYNDNGHSFDQCVFYGHENTLTICELLLFCVVDLIAENFLLATFIVYLFDYFLTKLRDGLGRSNLAKKTLVDERLLI